MEVIFELRWQIESDDDWSKYTYLPGDLYNRLRAKYPERSLLTPGNVPPELLKNKVVHRFSANDRYPLVQVGPGIITHNVTDEFYEWDTYYRDTMELLDTYFSLHSFDSKATVSPSLNYFDFFKTDWERVDILQYLAEHLHINLSQNIHEFEKHPLDLTLRLAYKTELGVLTLKIDKGRKGDDGQGIIIQTRVTGHPIAPQTTELSDWLSKSYLFCSSFFKEMTKGKLYDSFID